jgi:hypothetical protein
MAANGQRGAAEPASHMIAMNSTDGPEHRAYRLINLIGPRPLLHAAIVVGRPALELGDRHGNAIVSRRIGQSPRLPGRAHDGPLGKPGRLFL